LLPVLVAAALQALPVGRGGRDEGGLGELDRQAVQGPDLGQAVPDKVLGRMGKLDGKVCVITGASRGIGKAIAQLFAAEGGRVACAARTLKEGDHPMPGSLQTTVDEIRRGGGEATAIPADISEHAECVRLIERSREAYGPIDVLVNNAILTFAIPIKDYPLNRWHRAMAVSFHAVFYLSQLALQDMIPRRSGAIVNVSSPAAIGPGRGPYTGGGSGGLTLYGAEKAAMERFTQGLASEVYADGVSVTCYSPSGVVPTPGLALVVPELARNPGDPMYEPPEVMAQAALLLATEPLDKVTGRVTYSQAILREFGWRTQARGFGVDRPGSGYSQI
jgi:NAD(P)-dependent dehydrogenase (short-subunit alcohol dehydrogenase family)